MSIGIFPYLLSLFGDSEKDSYWLKHELINQRARFEKINNLYYKYNSYNFFDPSPKYLFCWQEFEMYKKALYHIYGPLASQNAAQSYPLENSPYLFNPGNFIKYIKYARAVVEDLSGRVPSIPWIFDYEQTDYGVARKREIKSFKAQMIGIREADLRFPRFTFGKPDFK
jgi:hypothetical protein